MYDGPVAEAHRNTKPARIEKDRETAAAEVCQLASEVCSIAESLANCMEVKLSPITRNGAEACPPSGSQAERGMPPLFSEYRSQLQHIRASLFSIEDTLNRVEL